MLLRSGRVQRCKFLFFLQSILLEEEGVFRDKTRRLQSLCDQSVSQATSIAALPAATMLLLRTETDRFFARASSL